MVISQGRQLVSDNLHSLHLTIMAIHYFLNIHLLFKGNLRKLHLSRTHIFFLGYDVGPGTAGTAFGTGTGGPGLGTGQFVPGTYTGGVGPGGYGTGPGTGGPVTGGLGTGGIGVGGFGTGGLGAGLWHFC